MLYFILTIIFFLLAVIIFFAVIFNNLTRNKTLVEEGWSGIDVQLKRRYDLIPQLVETVKMYVSKETQILTEVTELRSKAQTETSLPTKSSLEDKLSNNIKKINVIVENYPTLKSSENFIKIMDQLFEIEDQIQMSRRYYNGTVRNYNISVKTFPSNILASIFSFKTAEFFEADENAKKDVKVEF